MSAAPVPEMSSAQWTMSRSSDDDVGLDYLRDPARAPRQTPPRATHRDDQGVSEHGSEQVFARPPMALPDPSQFPDPYPFRPPHHHLNSMPALSSSGGSASNSTRSSAYASSGSNGTSGDYNSVHIASSDEGVGITPESVVQYFAKESSVSTARHVQARAPVDHSRWSDAYSSSARSRSSSISNNNSSAPHETSPIPNVPSLAQKPSYDISWAVDERDEVGILSEDETDDEQALDEGDSGLANLEEERTSAAVVADEGRGLIVQANNTPIINLQVQYGTTHLLIGSSTTPNAIPQFLTNTLPQIATTLLALDISANFLGALPPVLAVCENLEELNVASNPLRVLPVFLAELHNLRLLIADATGITTLPDTLVDLEKLHTLSVRRNKLHSLPSWLCLLPGLQTLAVDGNPFQGPWRALVDPLLAKIPMTPAYPPSTPVSMPQLSASVAEIDAEAEVTDNDDSSDIDPASPNRSYGTKNLFVEDEDHTITPVRAPILSRSITTSSTVTDGSPSDQSRPLQRTRTTPNRAYFEQGRTKPQPPVGVPPKREVSNPSGEVRKMKSAGDLRRGRSATTVQDTVPPISSASSSNLLNNFEALPALPVNAKRFGSLGPSSSLGPNLRPPINSARPQLSKSLWDDPSPSSETSYSEQQRKSYASSTTVVNHPSTPNQESKGGSSSRRPSTKDGKEKNSRWGFLKKMSMGKIKVDNALPSPPGVQNRSLSGPRPPLPPFHPEDVSPNPHARPPMVASSVSERSSKTPQIDLRFSSLGILDMPVLNAPPSPPQITKKPSRDLLRGPSIKSSPKLPSHPPVAAASTGLLAPPVPTPRNAKRRSFLPFEAPGALSIPIPDSSAFLPNVTVANGPTGTGGDEERRDPTLLTPSPLTPAHDPEQYIRREEERAREAYMRALRSVMAYLKDMNDLAQSQQPNPVSMYGGPSDEVSAGFRSRRPTMVEREVSIVSNGSAGSELSTHLRSSESIMALRSGTSSQTLSVATTDSSSSMDERKYKDDKGKRSKIVQELVATERTYVKGLQELVDIYIKPAATPVNLLSGVGTSKDTVVPSAERKIVFGGIDALFSFHHDSFLPALEKAAAPLFKPNFQETDPDGKLSTEVAKAVGDIIVKHAAFMRMYSSYINNFDNSVQRVKSWTSRTTGGISPGSAISPNSSTAQLVSLSLSVAGASASLDAGVPTLTTSQKKRIKTYLKRCRLNPRHTQLNLEGYLLLPVQRVPRYKLLLEELVRSTPPTPYEFMEDPLDRALSEISLLANNMNEGKRESESRRKLVQWQARIRGKFPSPLVQPHRRLIMDGRLLLTRVVRKAVVSFEAINAQGDAATVQVDCLAPELTPRPLVGILCNDLLVLCRDPSDGNDPNSPVDLWAVLRMQTLPQPASIVHGNALRLVDNKAILYFDAPSPSDALNWYRAINLHIPASTIKT